jgi:hypothetical protein
VAKAIEGVDTLPNLGGNDWIDWSIAHALASEAKGLIEGK